MRSQGCATDTMFKIGGVTTMGKLTDKNILITGGNSGIGLAAAQEFDERVRASPSAA